MYILCCTYEDRVRYAPLYIHSFRLVAPRKLSEARQFNQKYHCYEEVPTVQERLRWCRYQMGLMQKEVAERIGISRGRYIEFEVGAVDYYPKKVVDKLAELYRIPVEDLLDEFNRFLYYGQAKAIQENRQSLGLGKKPYARLLGVDPNSLRAWESEKKRITKSSWEKFFKGRIQI